ncbi:hypothetical protein phiOC_p198 [Ochrobactrum phage vB_OspM_OC]|nr:hypothetical protein phiOC_p198 [Ochrobactrum phage vB_OspM_OC]
MEELMFGLVLNIALYGAIGIIIIMFALWLVYTILKVFFRILKWAIIGSKND